MDPQEKARQVEEHLREQANTEAEAAARLGWQLPTKEDMEQASSRIAAGESRQAVFGPHARFYLFEVNGAQLIGRWNPHPDFAVERIELSCCKNQWGHPFVCGPRKGGKISDVEHADRRSLGIVYRLMLQHAPSALPRDWKRQLDSLHVHLV